MGKNLKSFILCLVVLCSIFHSDNAQAKAQTQTYMLMVKSTFSVLNVRQKPSIAAKVVGKLKKNQSVPMRTINYNKGFYEVIFRGKIAYVSSDYATLVKSNDRWLGSYFNSYYSGTGVITELYVYKKTSSYIYFVSQDGYRYDPTGNLSGAEMPWKYSYYYGKAKLTSSTNASFIGKSCKATLISVGKTIRVYQKSKGSSCAFTKFGVYDGYGGAYEK